MYNFDLEEISKCGPWTSNSALVGTIKKRKLLGSIPDLLMKKSEGGVQKCVF